MLDRHAHISSPHHAHPLLDALRCVAVLLVLATHLPSLIDGLYPSGWLAAHSAVARL